MIIQTSPLIYLGIHALLEGPGWSGIGIIQYIYQLNVPGPHWALYYAWMPKYMRVDGFMITRAREL